MTYVVTQNCCNDATCVDVCPVNCIHPAPGEPGYGTAELLHIDPATCIDCGACAEVCPVDAIVPGFDITDQTRPYLHINAEYFAGHTGTGTPIGARPAVSVQVAQPRELRVAIVGSGPAACYAAEDLLSRPGLRAEVTLVERLPFAGGLLRYGVAPDHMQTKTIEDNFHRTLRRPDLTSYFNVEVGTDVTVDELAAHHHAVLFASGAAADRRLNIPGEELEGSYSAREFVAWYNGHPDFAAATFDLSHPRVVVVGNGNVALDVARILTTDVELLRRTDIADHALEALAGSAVREVVVLGRRGPADAACTTPELLGLGLNPDVDINVDGEVSLLPEASTKEKVLAAYAGARRKPGHRRIVFQFNTSPVESVGDVRLRGVRVERRDTGTVDVINCGLLLRSVGYRGAPFAGLPFNELSGTIANVAGRVLDGDSDQPARGRYVAGWIKRGPTGVIGTNRFCARDTVDCIVDDFDQGLLDDPTRSAESFKRLIRRRKPDALGKAEWLTLDRHERVEGQRQGRPRVKMTAPDLALTASSAAHATPIDLDGRGETS